MSEDTVRAAALLPEECGMVARLRFNENTGEAELYFGVRTPQQEIAFGMNYYECDELLRTMHHLMQQIPPSKRGPKPR